MDTFLQASFITTILYASIRFIYEGCKRKGKLSVVHAVALSESHSFSKVRCEEITLVAGMGIVGDAHYGATVQHRSRVKSDPLQPNLRQVHLLSVEQIDSMNVAGYNVTPGALGENITTAGLDIHALPTGTLLRIGSSCLLAVTGERNPCPQIDGYSEGLREFCLLRKPNSEETLRRAGIMAVVIQGGSVKVGDSILVSLPPEPHLPLQRV